MSALAAIDLDDATIPVIDIGAAVAGEPCADVATALGRAGRSIGFVQIVGHGVDPAMFHRVYDAADALWAEPNDVLDTYRSPTGHPFRGVWYGLDEHGERIWQRLQNTRIDTPEDALGAGYDATVADFFGGNVHPAVPGLQEAIDACFAEGRRVGATLMRLIAIELGLAPDAFEPFFDKDVSYFAVQDYPAMPHAAPGGMRLGEHSDSGALTMLHQRGDYAGLQLRRTTGEIVTVPIMDEALVVNLGDLMARWTNDGWLATPHRVVDGAPGEARTSIAMHYLPNVDTVIAPFEQCVTAGAPAYEPVSMYEWNMRYFQKKSRVLRLADES